MIFPNGSNNHKPIVAFFKYFLISLVLLFLSLFMHRLAQPDESAMGISRGDGFIMFAAILLGVRLELGDVLRRSGLYTLLLLGTGWSCYLMAGRFPNPAHLLYLLAAGTVLGIYRARHLDDML